MFQEKNTSLFFLLTLLFLSTSCNNRDNSTSENDRNNEFLDSLYLRVTNFSFDKRLRINESDSLIYYSKKFKALDFQYKGLMLKTSLWSQISIDSAKYYSTELKNLAEENNDSFYLGKSLMKLGLYSKREKEIQKSFRYYNQAYINFKAIEDSVNISLSLLRMSQIQKSNGDFIGSKITAIDGLAFVRPQNNTSTRVGLYQNISTAFREEGNYDRALMYNIQALQIPSSIKNQRILKNTKANILADLKDYDKSIKILTELHEQIPTISDKKETARILNNLGYVKWLKNSNNEQSESLLKSAYDIRKDLNDIYGLISSNVKLTKFYEVKNSTLALYHAEEAYRNAAIVNSQTAQLEALDYIIRLKENPKEEASLYTDIDKKLTNINQQNRELYSVTKYENEELIKQNLITEADNLKKEKQNTWYLFGFILTVLLSSLIYVLLKNKHSKEKQQKVYETEARISKKIHDELANDVYSTMVQLENKSATVSEIIDELEGIYQNARDISQEKSVYKTNEEYVFDLKRMLGSFTDDEINVVVKGLSAVMWIDISEVKKVTTLRVLKELLVNMRKHSNASIVSIIFKRDYTDLNITYIDNGVGVYKNELINGTGLINAENRIQAIGGKFIFDETGRKGLKIDISIPI